MINVFYTWFGPPANAKDHPTVGRIRPDIWAPDLMAGSAPRDVAVKFCCMPEHAAAFGRELPGTVEVIEIQDPQGIRVFDPDPEDREGWVHGIIRRSLKPGDDGKLVIRNLVNAKNIWSLWCMYAYGGYHLDTGVYPAIGGATLNAPGTFGVPRITDDGWGGAWHTRVRFDFPWEARCSTVFDSDQVLEAVALDGRTACARKDAPKSHLKAMFDVWLMCSPAGHKAAQIALDWYIAMWCLMEKLSRDGTLNEAFYKSASRGAILSSVATGITHSGLGLGCLGGNLWETHLIATENMTKVPSLKLHKLGFRSHG